MVKIIQNILFKKEKNMKKQKFFDCILNNNIYIAPFKNIKRMYVISVYNMRIIYSSNGKSYVDVQFKNAEDMSKQIEMYKEYLNSEDNNIKI